MFYTTRIPKLERDRSGNTESVDKQPRLEQLVHACVDVGERPARSCEYDCQRNLEDWGNLDIRNLMFDKRQKPCLAGLVLAVNDFQDDRYALSMPMWRFKQLG